jgi:putative flippase GtrA
MKLLRQLFSFGLVGVAATLSHVGVAWLLIESTAINAYLANALGACAAFIVSFLGNANFTFSTNRSFRSSVSRYVWVSLLSLTLTSIILALTKHYGLSTMAYVVAVLMTVPPATFFLAKLWAFSPAGEGARPSRSD